VSSELQLATQEEFEDYPAETQWELKKLKPIHQQVAALIAQGMPNVQVAKTCGITPQYITMLLRQPLFKQYLNEKCEAVGVRMEALFEQSVEVIANTLQNGSEGGKLKAARLQLEATKRIGRGETAIVDGAGALDRLERLATRLTTLNQRSREVTPIVDAEFTEVGSGE
jgi:hypothetical protein